MAVFDAIYLGKLTTFIDGAEGNIATENASALLGRTFGGRADALAGRIVSVSTRDLGGQSNHLDNDNSLTNDELTFDLGDGSGPQTTVHDGLAVYGAKVTFTDGTRASVRAVLFQDKQGNLFLAPSLFANDGTYNALKSGPIRSLTLNNVHERPFNLRVDRATDNFVTCFTPGTMIDTPEGPRDVASLKAGDLVITVDRGAQPLRWIGKTTVLVADEAHLRPVRIAAGALGEGQPHADLEVSPQHRILVRSAIARRMFGAEEVLVAARHLASLPGIEIREDLGEVTYFHLLFDQHELVISNGAATESLYVGPHALMAVPEAAREEILTLFPALADGGCDVWSAPVRQFVPGRRGRQLALRHVNNSKPVLGQMAGNVP
ncbi:Hint domain-containing protein [Paracoccus fistulariae]|nr:Hint domain-containing protein [Paracoccus fistulariae]MDB6181493.1 Hint domain-containing protein [Paracoccus fistulariae]